MPRPHTREQHLTGRIGWLRAAALRANDGLVSVGSLVLAVPAPQASHGSVRIAGVSAWIAGAMSMAAGEYVLVSSRSDTQKADIELERRELEAPPRQDQREPAGTYAKRGLSRETGRSGRPPVGARGTRAGGARARVGALRVSFRGALALAVTGAVGGRGHDPMSPRRWRARAASPGEALVASFCVKGHPSIPAG